MTIAEQIGFIDDLIRETEGVKFKSYGVEQRLKALRAVRAALVQILNRQ